MNKKYAIVVKEVVFHTYEIEAPADIPLWDVREYFYKMSADDQAAALQSSDSLEQEVEDVEEMEDDQ